MSIRKKYNAEQIIRTLRDAEILLAEGQTVPTVSRKLGISEQSYYRWRKEYGGMKVVHAQRLKDLEKENSRLKKLLAEAELDPPPQKSRILGMENGLQSHPARCHNSIANRPENSSHRYPERHLIG